MKSGAFTVVAISVLVCAPAFGQRVLGEFAGTITDASQAAVPGARVTATDTATGRSWNATANETGTYRVTNLPTGVQYDVSVEQSGFKSAKAQGLSLDVGEVKRLDFMLEVGAVTETVTVSGEASNLNLERGEVSAVVNERRIVDLPLNGRNVYMLAELQPGVVRTAGSGLQDSEPSDAQV